MNASFTANPKKFLHADTFSFVEPRACGPPLSVDESVKSRKTYVAARMVHRLLAREPKRTRLLPTVLDLRPGILPLLSRNLSATSLFSFYFVLAL